MAPAPDGERGRSAAEGDIGVRVAAVALVIALACGAAVLYDAIWARDGQSFLLGLSGVICLAVAGLTVPPRAGLGRVANLLGAGLLGGLLVLGLLGWVLYLASPSSG